MGKRIVVPLKDQCTCEYCNDPLDARDSGTYVKVTGWAKNRKTGSLGNNSVTLCKPHRAYACSYCIHKLNSNIPLNQMELFHLPFTDEST